VSTLGRIESVGVARAASYGPSAGLSRSRAAVSGGIHDEFAARGFLEPLPILSAPQCRSFLRAARRAWRTPPADWGKGHAVTSRAFYEIACHPAIVETVVALLGEDVMLWGASLQTRRGGKFHPWHSDIESCEPAAKTVSVWVSIEHTSRESAMMVVPGSHRLGVSIQEMRQRLGKPRDTTSGQDVVAWAKELGERDAELVALEMEPGEALFFDGRLWHGSRNESPRTRHALLLQYATPDTPIRIPDFNHLDWPFRRLEQPRPACIMIHGSDRSGGGGVNRMVPPPLDGEAGPRLQLSGGRVHALRTPLEPDPNEPWKAYPIFRGATADLRDLTAHASTLKHKQCPHPPHRHVEEEILLVLSGEVDVILPDTAPSRGGNDRHRLRAGEFVYYPSNFSHTLETISPEPANYLMFKWQTDGVEPAAGALTFERFDALDRSGEPAGEGFRPRRLLMGPTQQLRKLECHVSTMTPGAGYEPHIDAYDVAIVVLEGEVETLGQRAAANDVIFYPAGSSHGMRNVSGASARYLVIEYHGSRSGMPNALAKPVSLWTKVRDPQRWKRKLKHISERLRGEL
jgi:quercetin dioxygenase-like cupin family protein